MRNPEQNFEAMIPPEDEKKLVQEKARLEEQREIPRKPEESYIGIGEKSVSFLGVEVPKGEGGRLVPAAEEFKEEYFYLEGHYVMMREVATALLLNKPILLEGGTGVYNKTTTIASMCRDLNMNYCKVNFDRETAREDVIGGQTLKIDENGKEKLEWYDGDLMYAIRHGGVAFLDEYNRQSKIAGIINPIMDAILNGRKEIANPYNENERVKVHPNFRLIAAQNPPGFEEGHEYTDRNQIPAETFGRWIYRKLPIEYSEKEQNKLLAGVIGEKVDINLPASEFRNTGEGLSVRELSEIPGMTHWRREIINIVRVLEAKSAGAKREMAKGQRQNLYFNPRLVMNTIPQYIARFYRGDINETVKNAFETCIVGMYSSEIDKQKIRLMLDQASWKPSVAESKRRGIEQTKPKKGARKTEEGKERGEFSELVSREQEKLWEFFGKEIEVPSLPDEITPEKYELWKELGFDLHYLPDEDLVKDRDLPGWEKKPKDWFYDQISEGNISADAVKLTNAWVLTDSRAKPQYDNGNQMYENDDKIGNVLKKLRQQGMIEKYKKADSRFNISWDELNRVGVKAALAKLLGVDPENLRLPRAIEWNYLGNAFHKEWGETNVWEWFEDSYDKGRERLGGGGSFDGGLSYVFGNTPFFRRGNLGFRPLVVFSSKK